jgi:phospholipid/cholesterol/gamma-HCH transport system substrate-binding protein
MSRAVRFGVFIVATLLILAGGVFLIGSKDLLLSSTYRLRAEFQNLAGLNNGAEVRVGGIHKGTVRRIELPHRSDGKVTVVMDLERSTQGVIKTDSVAPIKAEGLLGNKYIEISFGSEAAERVTNGDTIGSEPPLDPSDLIKKTGQILDATQDTMQNVESISSKVNQGEGTVGELIDDKRIYQEASAAATQAKAGETALGSTVSALSKICFGS